MPLMFFAITPLFDYFLMFLSIFFFRHFRFHCFLLIFLHFRRFRRRLMMLFAIFFHAMLPDTLRHALPPDIFSYADYFLRCRFHADAFIIAAYFSHLRHCHAMMLIFSLADYFLPPPRRFIAFFFSPLSPPPAALFLLARWLLTPLIFFAFDAAICLLILSLMIFLIRFRRSLYDYFR